MLDSIYHMTLKLLKNHVYSSCDRRERNLNEVDPCDRDVWRSSVRSAMPAASQLPGKEPTDVDDALASAL